MTDSTPTPDDPDGALERLNAIRRARGLEPIVERDPAVVWAEIRHTSAAGRALSHALQGSDGGVALAFDQFEAEADPLGLPDVVASVAASMAMPDDRPAVAGATVVAIAAWHTSGASDPGLQNGETVSESVRRIRAGIEGAVWGEADKVRSALSDVGLGNLVERLDMWLTGTSTVRSDDEHYENRLRRAACLMMLGEITGSADLARGHELARRENYQRPWLPILHVADRAGFITERHGEHADRDAVIADLRAELALLDRVPYLPDDDNPSGTT